MDRFLGRMFLIASMLLALNNLGQAQHLSAAQQKNFKQAESFMTKAEKATSDTLRNSHLQNVAKYLNPLLKDAPDNPKVKQLKERYDALRESLLDAEMAAIAELLRLAEQQLAAKNPAVLPSLKQTEQKLATLKQYGMERNHPKVQQANALVQQWQGLVKKYTDLAKNAQDTQKQKELEQQIPSNLSNFNKNLQSLGQLLQNYRGELRADDPVGSANGVLADAQSWIAKAEKELASVRQRFGEHALIQAADKKLAEAKIKVESVKQEIWRAACDMKVQEFIKTATLELENAKRIAADEDQLRNKRYGNVIGEYSKALAFLQENAKLADVAEFASQVTAARAKLLEKLLSEIGEIAIKSLEGQSLHRLIANLEGTEQLARGVAEVAITVATVEEKMIEAACQTILATINEHGITGWESSWNMLNRATEQDARRRAVVEKHRRAIVTKTLECTIKMLEKGLAAEYRESTLKDYLVAVGNMASGNAECVKLVEEYKAQIAQKNQATEAKLKKQYEDWLASLSADQKQVMQQWNNKLTTTRDDSTHWIFLKEGESEGLFTVHNYYFDAKGKLLKQDSQKREMYLPILSNGGVVGYILPNYRGNKKTDYLYSYGRIYDKDKRFVVGYTPERVQGAQFSGYYIEERLRDTWLKAAKFSVGDKDATLDYYPNWAFGDTGNCRTYNLTVPDLPEYKEFVGVVRYYYELTDQPEFDEKISIAAAAYVLLARR